MSVLELLSASNINIDIVFIPPSENPCYLYLIIVQYYFNVVIFTLFVSLYLIIAYTRWYLNCINKIIIIISFCWALHIVFVMILCSLQMQNKNITQRPLNLSVCDFASFLIAISLRIMLWWHVTTVPFGHVRFIYWKNWSDNMSNVLLHSWSEQVDF